MKTKLTLIAILFSLTAMAQTQIKSYTSDYFKIDTLKSAGYAWAGDASLLARPVIKSNWSQHWQLSTDYKLIMTISDQKPDSTYHVWIDKKAIQWTSDSTFILKRKTPNP